VWILINKKNWELPSILGWSFLIIGVATLLTGVLSNKIIDKGFPNVQSKTIWVSILMTAVLLGGFFAWQYNVLDSRRTERPFALQMKKAVKSLPHDRVAFWQKYEDKVLFYMEFNPPITLLSDENDLRVFLKSGEPGMIISQGRYITETVAAMLPAQPAYAETNYKWELPERLQKKLKAWLINANVSQILAENVEADSEK
jgi:hypothetical protein